MLIGAHVSTGGGLPNAIARGKERGCESIQIFHQSPRMWRPTKYGEPDFAAFREAMDASPVEAVIIHAVYLINCATKDKELRKKSLTSLTHALTIGDGTGAKGVVLHPGSQKTDPLKPSLKRASKVIAEALKETDSCPLLIEQTAGHKGLLARDFDQTAELIDLAGGGKRLGLCLDSAVPLGACLDRHANIGKGEMGKRGLSAFLSEPRFEGLPATLETPGPEKKGSSKAEVTLAKRLRREGLKRRGL
jgi:deoxyribonuclease-4